MVLSWCVAAGPKTYGVPTIGSVTGFISRSAFVTDSRVTSPWIPRTTSRKYFAAR